MVHQRLRRERRVKQRSQLGAVLTDSHFLIPAVVLLFGITLLVVMH